MSKDKNPFNSDNPFDELKQKAKADTLKRQDNISMIIREMGLREKLKEKLEEGGIFLAGLSGLKEIDILYLIGACSKEERLKYIYYEKKYRLKKKELIDGFSISINGITQKIEFPDFEINPIFKSEDLLYEDVASYAENFGVSFDITHENLLLAKEIKRTAFAFEMLKTNIHELKFPYEDGLDFSNWYDKTSYEESEIKILQNLICLLNTLKIEDEEAKSFLNLLIYLRLFSHAKDLYMRSEKKDTAVFDSLRMKYTSEFFFSLIPQQLDFSPDEKFIFLYMAIQKTKDALKKYHDKETVDFLLKWLEFGVKKFEENVPDNFKELKILLPQELLNTSFYLKKQEGENLDLLNIQEEEPQLIKSSSLFEQVNQKLDEKMLEYDEGQREMWKNEMELLPPSFHVIYKLAHLPDVYFFYALGIIDEDDLDVLTQKIKDDFSKNSLVAIDKWVEEFISHIDGNNPEIMEKYAGLKADIKDNQLSERELIKFLEEIGFESTKISDLLPSTKEALSSLLQEDFDTHIPLALKFKKDIFKLARNFKDLAAFLTEKIIGVNTFSLDLNLSLEKCTEADNEDLTKIARLMICGDILDAVQGTVRPLKQNDEAYTIINNLIAGYYSLTLQKILALADEDKQPQQAQRIQELFGFYDVFNINLSILSSEKEKLPFLIALMKLNLKSFSNSKATQAYYLDWFDYVLDFSKEEKEELNAVEVSLPKYRKNLKLDDSMNFSEQKRFLNDLANYYFTENDQKANHYDKRVAFGLAPDVDLLYAMGIFSPFEYDKLGDKNHEMVVKRQERVPFFDVWTAVREESPGLKLPLMKEVFDVMKQIQLAGRLLDYSYNYENLLYSGLNYDKQEPETTVFDFNKKPLKAEGKMLDSILMMMKDLKEYNLEESSALRKILNSYWKESVQGLNSLALMVKKQYPEMEKRIMEQRGIFGIKPVEKQETISTRFKYYPKLFMLMRQTLEKEYKYRGGLTRMQNFFEKEIKSFVDFYGKRSPILKSFIYNSRQRE